MTTSSMILMSDPRVAAIPVRECGEPLVDVRSGPVPLLVDARRSDPDGSPHLRERVREQLVAAQAQLPDGLRLLVVEGYRPLSLQTEYFERYAQSLRTGHPQWTAREVRDAASRYVSPPEIAPHSAGAAVDLTLVDAGGRELDMGTAINANPEDSDGACFTAATNISRTARANRAILTTAVHTAGLQVYSFEWWHFSLGDRYWALIQGQPAALYGPTGWPS
ncbi:D-alanyl-D-alanine dipeptidase [Streptomyces sp. MnatMP-M77]|uniref:M15 family metallopeptidase n=1 Tax=unclassified Streptomyces TaxID=2593676 RepID=UPI0008048285|nr:M15 family metallopeptidase [Streptomyces sp. MnatMP-M77]MYT82412.1 dipeptidase [Streptomyces sp. SID8364]SBU96536.1 D-alanyl-D-alanine dipeptidase [Streptomyces sp. MnatMP-M77]